MFIRTRPEEEGQRSPDRLCELADLPKVVGIGETGLDYFYDHSPREAQQRSFRSHIAAARQTGLPLIVHTRDADADTVAILREEAREGAVAGVIHCFTAGPELAEAALELGFYIRVCRDRDLQEGRRVARDPAPGAAGASAGRDRRALPGAGAASAASSNEPAFVVHTAAALAELKAVRADELAAVTTENFYTLFSRVQRPAGA